MHFDVNSIHAANDLATGLFTAIVTIIGYVTAHKRGWLIASVKEVVKDAPEFVKDAEVVAQSVAEVSPTVAQAEQSVADEVAKITTELRQTQLYKVATVGLHAFGVALAALSPDQKKALSYFVSSHVQGVTQDEIDAALAFVQKETDDAVQSPIFIAANAYTEANKTA